MRLKGTVSVAQENAHDGSRTAAADWASVGHSQIGLAIAIEVPNRDGDRIVGSRIFRGSDKDLS